MDRHKQKRRPIWLEPKEWTRFEKAVNKLKKETGIPDLQYKQAFRKILEVYEDTKGLLYGFVPSHVFSNFYNSLNGVDTYGETHDYGSSARDSGSQFNYAGTSGILAQVRGEVRGLSRPGQHVAVFGFGDCAIEEISSNFTTNLVGSSSGGVL